VRPEDIFDKSLAPTTTAHDGNTLKAMVDVIEPMGAVVTMYLTLGTHQIVATIDADTKAKEGEELEIVLDMDKTHLFDKETQKAIY
jgi:multiple sugar transport system ATP-binding protein